MKKEIDLVDAPLFFSLVSFVGGSCWRYLWKTLWHLLEVSRTVPTWEDHQRQTEEEICLSGKSNEISTKRNQNNWSFIVILQSDLKLPK